jgi:outer membrane immunogenic protein
MRKVLLSTVALAALTGSAFAADLPSTKAAPMLAPSYAYDWTGFYIGAEVGAQFTTAKDPNFWSSTQTNTMLGGIVGYNWQFANKFVLGLEGDGGGVFGTRHNVNPLVLPFTNIGTTNSYFGDIRGRFGLELERALVYVAGGVAFGDQKTNYIGSNSYNSGRTGWTVGGGVEYAFTNNWIGRFEYRYTDLGSKSYVVPVVGAAAINDSVRFNSSAVLFGVLYKFGGPVYTPVVAKY